MRALARAHTCIYVRMHTHKHAHTRHTLFHSGTALRLSHELLRSLIGRFPTYLPERSVNCLRTRVTKAKNLSFIVIVVAIVIVIII